jgi:Flp pilus assembly protein TadD
MLNWIIGSLAGGIWGIGIFWAFCTIRRRMKAEEDHAAQMEAEAIGWSEKRILEAMERYPRSPAPAVVYARHAHGQGDFEEALRRYRLAMARGPNDERGFSGAAVVLRDLGRLDEAEALLRRAQHRFPGSNDLRAQFAWVAQRRKDWPEEARRWASYRVAAPADKLGYEQGVKALRNAGRIADADALTAEATGRFDTPSEPTRVAG